MSELKQDCSQLNIILHFDCFVPHIHAVIMVIYFQLCKYHPGLHMSELFFLLLLVFPYIPTLPHSTFHKVKIVLLVF